MRSEIRSLSRWVIAAGSFLGAAVFLVFAVFLALQILDGHGSPAGNFLRFALAIVSFFVGFLFVAVGTLYRTSFDNAHRNEFQ